MTKKTISLKDSLEISEKNCNVFFKRHINPGLLSIYRILGFANMPIESAKGLKLFLKDGRTILDFTSGIGVLALGHNHPKIVEAEKFCHEKNIIDVQKFGVNRLQAILAYNISQVMPEPLDTSFFSVSGAEAIEAGIKLITRIQPSYKEYFISFREDYHGKTHGALSFSNTENFSTGFHTSIPKKNVILVEHGNISNLEKTILNHKLTEGRNSIAALIIEPIQGQTLEVPPRGYLNDVLELCKKNDILMLVDEIKVGMGRTGNLFSFFDENIVPDIVTISKALGGGKRAIGVMVTSAELSKKAYGKRKDSALHSTTFGGLGETCAVAIETLDIISSKIFLDDVKEKSVYFFDKLNALQKKYPEKITNIIGKGLFIGVEFDFSGYEKFLTKLRIPFINDMRIALMGSIVRCLYEKYGLLLHFTPPRPNVLVIMPPLIITKKEIDYFTTCFDNLLEKDLFNLLTKFVTANVKDLIPK